MALEIAGVTMDKLVSIEASATARFVRHAVPGLAGDYAQELGRPSVRIRVRGIFYGDDALERLKDLRGHLLDRTPVDFLCELTGEGYFSQVLVDHLEVAQRAGHPGELDYECVVTEYVPPPPPPAASALDGLDLGILDEAAALVDEAQDALAQVAGLANLLAGAGDFGDPTTRLPAMLKSFTDTAGGAAPVLAGIGALVGDAGASLPDLSGVTNASRNAQSGLTGFLRVAGSLAGDPAGSPLQGIAHTLGRLDRALDIDLSGLSQRLPQALATIEKALPGDALRFVEALKDSYREVSGFLGNSPLVRQIHPGATLEQTALALVDEVLRLFQTRLDNLGSSLIDTRTLAQVQQALATIEDLAAGSPVAADEVREFLAQNLLGIPADFLDDATTRLGAACAVLEPFSDASLDARIAATRDALVTDFRNLATALHGFDPKDLAAYTALEAQLQTFDEALDAAFAALDGTYCALTAAVAVPAWDSLFEAYTAVLGAIHLDEVPTLDDAIDAIAGMLETLLARLTMSLSPADLAAQVAAVAGAIHDLFAQSAPAQVRQILIDFIGKIQAALEQIPTREVQDAVQGMLGRVHQELDALGIDQVRTGIRKGFQAAQDVVDREFGGDLPAGLNATLAAALGQLKNIPIAELGQELATAVQAAGAAIQGLEGVLASGLGQIQTLLESLDGIDFSPAGNEVVDEIDALKSRLAAIRPASLSDVERVAIQAGLSLLRAIDLEGKIDHELKQGFADLAAQLTAAVQAVIDTWLGLRRRIGGLDGASLAAPVTGLLDQAGNAVQGVNGTLVVAPLQTLVDGLMVKAQALSPSAILDPLQQPYTRMMQTIERANPDLWVEPVRALHAQIERLIALVDITPLLSTLEQREKDLFAQARRTLADALEAVHLPAPLDTFYAQMKALALGLTDAIFADPDGTLRQTSLSMAGTVRPSTLFEPLDLAFDRLLAALEARPADQVLAALEAIRQGIGAALPALDPAHLVQAMREAQGRIAATTPANLAGVVALPGLRARLAAQLARSDEHAEAKAALLARFDLVLARLDPARDASRLRQLTLAHQALAATLRRRIDALDTAGAQTQFHRLDAGLGRVLPAFLRQSAPLGPADVRAGLATLRPSTKARRIDLAVERFLAQLAPLQDALEGSVGGFFQEIRQAALMLHPGGLKESVAAVYATLHERLAVLDPDQLAGALRTQVWEPLMDPLRAIDPAALKAPLDTLFQGLLARITGAVHGLLDQVKQAVDAFLGEVRTALAQVVQTLKAQIEQVLAGVTALLAQFDRLVVQDLFQRLRNLIANLQLSFDQELDRVRNEFASMLNAIPLESAAAGGIT